MAEYTGPPGGTGGTTNDERSMATLAHLGGILFGFIPSLLIYLLKGKESQYVKEESAEALNFQITLAIAYFASAVLIILLIGLLLLPAVWITGTIMMIIAATRTNKGELYRYPINFRLVKP